MKKLRNLMAHMVMFLAVMAIFPACSTVTPGQITVEVQVCGEAKDVDRYTVIHSGRYWSGACKDHYKIPTREQRAVWTKTASEGSEIDESISFSGVDGQAVNIDVGIGYMVNPDSDEDIIKMIRTYGPKLETTIDGRVRDQTRDALNRCAAENEWVVQDLYGASKDDLMTCAEQKIQAEFNSNGLIITRLTLNSDVRLPERIREAMQRAQAATQQADQARREIDKAVAEGEKTVAVAKAAAEAMNLRTAAEANRNRELASSLSPALLELQRLEVQLEQAKKWDGKLPETLMGGEIPMLMMQKTK